jgi:hypothetical protein
MYASKHTAEAMAELLMVQNGEGDMDAMCDPEDRIASDTGLSVQALRQLMSCSKWNRNVGWGRRCSSGRLPDGAMESVTGSDQGGPAAIGSGHG